MDNPISTPYMTIQELAELLGVAIGTLYNWRSAHIGPKSFRIGGRIRYRCDAVEAWLTAQETAEAHVA